jgi:hypothetical protein
MDFDRAAGDFRRKLQSGREDERARLLAAYGRMEKNLDARLTEIAGQVAAAAARGESPRAAWERERQRLESLKSQLGEEIRAFTGAAAKRAEARQGKATQAAGRYVIGADPDRFLKERLQAYVGVTGDGSPLTASFQKLANDMGARSAAAVEMAVERGIQLQRSPKQIAADIRKAVRADGGDPAQDAEIVRRTDLAAHAAVMFAARNASWAAMESSGVREWEWSSNRGAATCPVCWGNHGRRFTGAMNSHPNCRCVMKPVSESWEDILRDAGVSDADIAAAQIPDTRLPQDGEADFSRLSEPRQKQILGNAGLAAYQAGDLALVGDLGVQRQTAYGRQWTTASLKSVLGDNLAEFYYRGNRRELGSVAERLERAIAGRPYEAGFIVDSENRVVLRKRGEARAIFWSDDDLKNLRGATLIHNHPSGQSFSAADLRFAAWHNLAQIIVVTPEFRFSMRAETVIGRDGISRRAWPSPRENWLWSLIQNVFAAARTMGGEWADRAWESLIPLLRARGEARIIYVKESRNAVSSENT